MTARRTVTVLGLLAFALPAAAAAQGLGDAAARERARRAREAETSRATPAPTYGNEDLSPSSEAKKGEAQSGAPAQAEPASPSADEGPHPGAGDVIRDRRARIDAAQAEFDQANAALAAIEGRIKELQDMLNPMSGSFIYGAGGSNNANDEAFVRSELSRLEGQLDEPRRAVTAARQGLEDAERGRVSPTSR